MVPIRTPFIVFQSHDAPMKMSSPAAMADIIRVQYP
jgi:hypothetical protein